MVVYIVEHLLTCTTPGTWCGKHPAATSGSPENWWLGIRKLIWRSPWLFTNLLYPSCHLGDSFPHSNFLEPAFPSAWAEGLTIDGSGIECRKPSSEAFNYSASRTHRQIITNQLFSCTSCLLFSSFGFADTLIFYRPDVTDLDHGAWHARRYRCSDYQGCRWHRWRDGQ